MSSPNNAFGVAPGDDVGYGNRHRRRVLADNVVGFEALARLQVRGASGHGAAGRNDAGEEHVQFHARATRARQSGDIWHEAGPEQLQRFARVDVAPAAIVAEDPSAITARLPASMIASRIWRAVASAPQGKHPVTPERLAVEKLVPLASSTGVDAVGEGLHETREPVRHDVGNVRPSALGPRELKYALCTPANGRTAPRFRGRAASGAESVHERRRTWRRRSRRRGRCRGCRRSSRSGRRCRRATTRTMSLARNASVISLSRSCPAKSVGPLRLRCCRR